MLKSSGKFYSEVKVPTSGKRLTLEKTWARMVLASAEQKKTDQARRVRLARARRRRGAGLGGGAHRARGHSG